MITVRKAADRGHTQIGWLDSHHSFSFNTYHDQAHMGFRSLRVINDDRVAAGAGFPRHGHRDMEILTWVLEGALEHEDSTGARAVLLPGMIQRMSAGSGIVHSEYNHSKSEPVHFYQIWIQPSAKGIEPRFEDRSFPAEGRTNKFQIVASPEGEDGSPELAQDATVLVAAIAPGAEVQQTLPPGRYGWLQVARGTIELNGILLESGDGAAVSEESSLTIKGLKQADLILFDLS